MSKKETNVVCLYVIQRKTSTGKKIYLAGIKGNYIFTSPDNWENMNFDKYFLKEKISSQVTEIKTIQFALLLTEKQVAETICTFVNSVSLVKYEVLLVNIVVNGLVSEPGKPRKRISKKSAKPKKAVILTSQQNLFS